MISKIKNPYFSALLITVIYYAVVIGLTWILFTYIDLDFFESDINVFALEIIPYLLILIFGIIIAKSVIIDEKYELRARFIVVVIFIALISRILNDPIFRFYQIINKFKIPENIVSAELTSLQYFLTIAKTIIIIPIIEEFFFRGIILKSLIRKNKNMLLNILFTSFLFLTVHINFISINYITLSTIFIFSVISGFIFIKYGLLYSIIFHWLYNAIWLILIIYEVNYWAIIKMLDFHLGYWLAILFSVFVLFYFGKTSLKKESTSL